MAATGPGAPTLPGPLPAGGRVPDVDTDRAAIAAALRCRDHLAEAVSEDDPERMAALMAYSAAGLLAVALLAVDRCAVASAAVRLAYRAGRMSRD